MLPPTPPQQDQPGLRKHFGRLKLFDERSIPFSIRGNRLSFWRSLAARVRTEVHHHVWWMGNQGATSQCGGYSLIHAWEAGKGHARGAGYPLHGYVRPIMKPSTIYARAQQLDPWPGSETEEPKYEGTSGTAAAKAAQEFGLITGYDWEFNDIEVCERAIFTAPLIFGIDWKAGMMLDGQSRSHWSAAIIKAEGETIGGHLIACVGYDKKRKGAEFELLNSWGRDWGFDGRCFIGRDDLGTLLADEGECVMLRDNDDTALAAILEKARGNQ
jgi:papain like protease